LTPSSYFIKHFLQNVKLLALTDGGYHLKLGVSRLSCWRLILRLEGIHRRDACNTM